MCGTDNAAADMRDHKSAHGGATAPIEDHSEEV